MAGKDRIRGALRLVLAACLAGTVLVGLDSISALVRGTSYRRVSVSVDYEEGVAGTDVSGEGERASPGVGEGEAGVDVPVRQTGVGDVAPAKDTSGTAGEERVATRNLAVSVASVEPGPYDWHDGTPTVRVTVRMHNTSGRVVYVKPSNWDADTLDGRRVDHKIWVEDSAGSRAYSFGPVGVSPGSTYEGVLYFDGDGLRTVLYEPHWLISSEEDLVRFEVGQGGVS